MIISYRKILWVFFLLAIPHYSTAQNGHPNHVKPEDRICFALYTVHENTLKLTAQLYPIENFEPFEVILQIFENEKWITIDTTEIIYPGYTAPFRIENWDDTKEVKYRVVHNNQAFYDGLIRKNPMDNDEFVMASLSCNSVYPQHGGDISKEDIVDNLKRIQPDLLFFSGDQVYDHSEHLAYWLKFGRDFGDIIRSTPTICIPDDHDIGQANLWGESGKKESSRRGHLGGYYMPVEYIREVERAQTSHLPDPFDPTPIEQGIGVYYTDLNWGGISFAILEDRKFKSGLVDLATQNPEIFPEGPSEALFDPDVDARRLDISSAKLLGDRQLQFLEHWTTDWENATMKTVLSQTIFVQANNYTGKHDRPIINDFDTNGWPQAGRNRALSTIRKSFSPMIAGDQHLATVVQHGVQNWGDAGYSFASPAIANYWLRWWDPSEEGKNKAPDAPYYTGEFYDGFQNKMTVLAVANPSLEEIKEGGKLSTRVAGYGLVRYNKKDRTITFECWGRNIDITDPNSQQYEGWPITISQTDNFNIQDGYELPMLMISRENQVVTVRDSYTNEVMSSIRVNGKAYKPKVLNAGSYTLEVGEGISQKRIYGVMAKKRNTEKLKVELE
ncbi:alkaline phosphatase D family protein [Pontibacter sp. G13]|uniref:alkaline phosphatase D family protein n=1 Tax=Pontibacter sp. G13 TaxID=3074898 RepID=UPI002889D03B|nr:alkaline phosphatase D family protein [Pontibacter sp. G13]WNJ17894.1 alkaline phosphatase D family protein [Pontibacter sp. G13]